MIKAVHNEGSRMTPVSGPNAQVLCGLSLVAISMQMDTVPEILGRKT